LFGDLADDPVATPVEAAPRSRFVDPSPHALTIGPESLQAFLERSRSREVFEIRRLIREADYRGFYSRYHGKGRAPYHPALMSGLVLYALMRGRRSLREIEAFARENVSAWWLTGGACPDHASIGRFISRFGDLLAQDLFEELTAKILKATGTSGSDLAGDGTTIPSMAKRFGLLCEEAAREKASELRASAARLPSPLREKLERKAASYERAAEATTRKVHPTGKNPTTRSVKVARADPEATHQRLKNGLPAPSYKPTILSNEARIVVAHDVQSSSENAAINGLCEQAKRVGGGELECVRLDAGFFSGAVLQTLLDQDVANPLVTDQAVVSKLRGKKPPKYLPKTSFKYDEESDTYECPAGEILKLVKHRKVRHTKIYGGAPCLTCPLRRGCTKSKTGRTVERYYKQEKLLQAMRHVMTNPLAQESYAKRSAMVEPVFADLRQRQGFWRFLRAGLKNVRIEFALQALAHNLLKFLSLTLPDRLYALLRALAALHSADRSPAAFREATRLAFA